MEGEASGVLFAEHPRAIIECLLFVATEPLDIATLAKLAEIEKEDARIIIGELMSLYNTDGHGIHLLEMGGGYQLATRPDLAVYIEKLYKPHIATLSRAALETLAIIAYQQPVTRAEIEQIRGVKVEGVLSTLMERRVVKEVGRKDGPGRPILYGTTREFLNYFGLNSLNQLPPLTRFSKDE